MNLSACLHIVSGLMRPYLVLLLLLLLPPPPEAINLDFLPVSDAGLVGHSHPAAR